MSKKLISICVIVALLSAVSLSWFGGQWIEGEVKKRNESIRYQGERAFRVGVPANANPYLNEAGRSHYWLEGWIEAAQDISSEASE